jgi:hypothetical protein
MKKLLTSLTAVILGAPAFAHQDAMAHIHTSQTSHVPLVLLVGGLALGGLCVVRYLRGKP